MLPLMDNVLCWFGNGCILAMLEPHLAEIGADNRTISITFLLFGLVFALSTPITGIVSSNFHVAGIGCFDFIDFYFLYER